jgi:molecular chaperone Hsp33
MDPHTLPAGDQVRRFIFEKQPVRGHWVRLESAWRELRAHTPYPPAVSELLGQAVAASVLLAATLKFRGTLTFQLQGNRAVGLLVAQCAHDFRLRAVARYDEAAVRAIAAERGRGAIFRQLVGAEGRIMVTIEAEERSMRYQGVVPLSGTSLAECLETSSPPPSSCPPG